MRVLRYRGRLQDAAQIGSIGSDDATDLVHSFFQSVWHLKDHIKNDPRSGLGAAAVESFANCAPALRIAADICNGTKHLRLTSAREGAMLAGKDITVVVGQGASHRFRIKVGTAELDAFTVADECVHEWRRFLTDANLLES